MANTKIRKWLSSPPLQFPSHKDIKWGFLDDMGKTIQQVEKIAEMQRLEQLAREREINAKTHSTLTFGPKNARYLLTQKHTMATQTIVAAFITLCGSQPIIKKLGNGPTEYKWFLDEPEVIVTDFEDGCLIQVNGERAPLAMQMLEAWRYQLR